VGGARAGSRGRSRALLGALPTLASSGQPAAPKRGDGGENGSVIVTCERCETEFQLDDTRVPESGARVRCSRCKHAFFVIPPAASREAMIERAAGDALEGDTIPDVTEELTEPPVEI